MKPRPLQFTLVPRLRSESGQSLVELAVVLPLVLLVVLALVDFGRAVHMYLNATHVANEGARLAAVDFAPAGGGSLLSYIQQQTYGELRTGSGSGAGAQGAAVVCIDFPGPNTAEDGSAERGNPVTVTVKSSYNWIPGGIIPGSITIGGSATMRLEQDPSFLAGCTA